MARKCYDKYGSPPSSWTERSGRFSYNSTLREGNRNSPEFRVGGRRDETVYLSAFDSRIERLSGLI